jgi:hypothetical protein
MKAWGMLAISVLLGMTAAAGHYYRVQGDRVSFYLEMPTARNVYFTHSLNGFKLQRAEQGNAGTWAFTMTAKFEFRYFYIIDGDVFVPACAFREADDFGFENCIFVPGS